MGTATKRLNWSRVSESKWVADQGAQSGQGWERPLCAGGKAGALGCLQAATAWRETMSSCSCLVPGRQAWRERKPNPLIGSAETSPASTWIRSIPLQFISSSPPGVWEARLLFVQAGLKSHGCPCLLITCSYSMIYEGRLATLGSSITILQCVCREDLSAGGFIQVHGFGGI